MHPPHQHFNREPTQQGGCCDLVGHARRHPQQLRLIDEALRGVHAVRTRDVRNAVAHLPARHVPPAFRHDPCRLDAGNAGQLKRLVQARADVHVVEVHANPGVLQAHLIRPRRVYPNLPQLQDLGPPVLFDHHRLCHGQSSLSRKSFGENCSF